MSPADIIDMASRRCGKRGVNDAQLNINLELLVVIQEFCKERPWAWRSLSVSYPLALNTKSYDLWATYPDFQKMESIKIVIDPLTTPNLDKVNDPYDQGAILEGAIPGRPDKHFVTNGHILVVYPIPDAANAVFPLRFSYFAVPNTIYQTDGVTLLAAVPVVPFYCHDALVKGLERQILRYAVGAEDAKYTLADAEYKAAVQAAWEP